MKKVLFFVTVLLCISLLTYRVSDNARTNSSNVAKPTQPFGNQMNNSSNFAIGKGGYIYVGEMNAITKISIDGGKNRDVVFKDKTLGGRPEQITEYGNWIYFIVVGKEDIRILYRIPAKGGAKSKLIDNTNDYILAGGKIYYTKGDAGGNSSILSTNLDGSNDKMLLRHVLYGYSLVGIDSSWLYYYKNWDESSELYRMKLPTGKKEKIFDILNVDDTTVGGFIADGDDFYYTKLNELSQDRLMIGSIREKPIIIDEGLINCLNQSGNWLFYVKGFKVYKINTLDSRQKYVVHDFNSTNKPEDFTGVDDILLHDNSVLIVTYEGDELYVKEDCTVKYIK